jgi:general stress protein 26
MGTHIKKTDRPPVGEAAKLFDLLRTFDTAMLTSLDSSGRLRSRPMAIAEIADDGTLWFVTSRESAKTDEVAVRPDVIVTMQGKGAQIAASGQAHLVDDRRRIAAIWNKRMDLWWPDGPTDPDAIALAVELTEGEYWDARGLRGLKFAMRAIRALVSDEEVEVDRAQHGTVHVRGGSAAPPKV